MSNQPAPSVERGIRGRIRGLSLRTSAAAILAFCALLGAPATAAVAADPMREAIERVSNGTWTDADLELIRSDPEIAGQVPDPKAEPETGVDSSDDATVRAVCGAWVDAWYRKRSLLGSTIYVYHQRVDYCRDGTRVTAWQSRYDYLTEAQGIVYWREQTVNRQGGIGTTAAWSHLARHIELCSALAPCHASLYPWIRITVRGDGTYTYTGAAS